MSRNKENKSNHLCDWGNGMMNQMKALVRNRMKRNASKKRRKNDKKAETKQYDD